MNVDSDNNVNMGGPNSRGARGRGRGGRGGGRQQRERGERRSGLKETSAVVSRVQNRGRGARGNAARSMSQNLSFNIGYYIISSILTLKSLFILFLSNHRYGP